MSKRIILAGGSGFLGGALADELLERKYEVIILTRSPKSNTGQAMQVGWDGKTIGPWASLLEDAEAVVNLTGKSVNCRYTPANRKEIIESRVDSVRTLGEAIQRCSSPPKVLVQTGSLAIFGYAGDKICDENASPGEGFPVETCLLWESAFASLDLPRTRKLCYASASLLGATEEH